MTFSTLGRFFVIIVIAEYEVEQAAVIKDVIEGQRMSVKDFFKCLAQKCDGSCNRFMTKFIIAR